MTRAAIGRSSRFLSGYCLVVAQNDDGRIKLFGSPADHASVEVGDEIIEINGRMLHDATHEAVIAHIHESIRSRRVSLKVRRRKGKRLVDEFPSYCIQNAYIVSSDDQVQPCTDFIPAKDGVIVSPTDMASLVDDVVVDAIVTNKLPENDEINIPVATLNVGICISKPPTPDSAHEPDSPSPEADFIRPISAHKHHLSVEDLLQRTLRNIDTCIQLSKAHEGLYFNIPASYCNFDESVFERSSLPLSFPFPLASEENSRISSSLQSSDSACDMGTQIRYSTHREMAVDVPDQFLGAVRGPLRYPISASEMALPTPAMLEAEKIKRHHADAVRRREEEEQRIKRDEFLRTSLRNSKRLKALEKSSRMAQPPGFYNDAFEDEQFTQNEPSSIVGIPAGIEMFDVPDSQSMKRALDHIAAVLKRDNSEFTEELSFIESLFNSTAFNNAADLHNLIETRQLQITEPVSSDADTLLNTVLRLLPRSPDSQEVQELRAILSTPEFKHFLLTHDSVAKETVKLAQLTALPGPVQTIAQSNGIDETGNHLFNQANINSSLDGNSSFNSDTPTVPVGESVSQSMPDSSAYPPMQLHYNGLDMPRIVKIEKNADTFLGATIRIDEANGSVMIARIVHGGAAQKSGLLHEGDELIEVNSIELRGRSLDEVSELLARMVGTLTFLILPGQHSVDMPPRRDYALHVRANFDYDPENDPHLEALQCPCEKLGLSFRKRDILHILNRDDKCWWQANRDGEEVGSVLAGLIPSTEHQQRRHDHMAREDSLRNVRTSRSKRDTISSKRFGGKKVDKSKKRRPIINGSPLDLGVGEVPWYEEVALFYPKPGQRRPIVLLGPAHMGRKELLEKLIVSDPDRFAKPVAHTTRPTKPGELNTREHYFVSKHQFDGMVLQHQFVEFGVYERHSYGTSIAAINDVLTTGKVCLLVVEPSAVAILRASNFKPFVVLIVPPPLDKLQQNRMRMGVPADEMTARRIIEDAQDIEETYGHFIDLVIENTDEGSTFSYLLSEINRLEREAQWVPAEWLR